jgi:hypothetical protein
MTVPNGWADKVKEETQYGKTGAVPQAADRPHQIAESSDEIRHL